MTNEIERELCEICAHKDETHNETRVEMRKDGNASAVMRCVRCCERTDKCPGFKPNNIPKERVY